MKKYNFKRLLAVVLAITIIASTVIVGGAVSNSVFKTTTVTYNFTDSAEFANELNRLTADSVTIAKTDTVNLGDVFSEGADGGLNVKGEADTLTQILCDDGNGNKLAAADASYLLVPGSNNETVSLVYAKSKDGTKYYAVSLKTESDNKMIEGIDGAYTKTVATFYTITVAEGKITDIVATSSKNLAFKNHYDVSQDNAVEDYVSVFTFFSFTDKAAKAITWDSITKPIIYDVEVSYDSESGKMLLGGTINVDSSLTSGTKKFDIDSEITLDESVCEHATGIIPAATDAVVKKIEAGFGLTEVDVQATVAAFEQRVAEEVTAFPVSPNLQEKVDALVADYNNLAPEVKYFYTPDSLNAVKAMLDQGVDYYDTFDSVSYFNSAPYWEPVATWDENLTLGNSKNSEPDIAWNNVTDPTANGFWGIIADENGNNALNLRKNFYYTDTNDAPKSSHSVLYNLKDTAGGNNERDLYEISTKLYFDATGAMKTFFVLEYADPVENPNAWTSITLTANTSRTALYKNISKPSSDPTNVKYTTSTLANVTDANGANIAFKTKQYLDVTLTYNFATMGYDVTVTGVNTKNATVTGSAFYSVAEPVKGVYIGSTVVDNDRPSIDDISVKFLSAKMVSNLIAEIGEITLDNVNSEKPKVDNAYRLYSNLSETEYAKLTDDEKTKIENAKQLADKLQKEYVASTTPLNMLDFEDGSADIMGSSGAVFSVASNPGATALNPSSKVLAVSSAGNTNANKVTAFVDESYIGNPLHTVSVDVYLNGANSPVVYYDYKDADNWGGVFLSYASKKVYVNTIGRTSNLALNGSGNTKMKLEVTTMNGNVDYNEQWVKLVINYHKQYVTVQLLFEDGNIGSPIYDTASNTSWNIKYRSGNSSTGVAFGAEGTGFTSYFDNISINSRNDTAACAEAMTFESKYADLMKLTPATLSNTDVDTLNSAIEDYVALSPDAKTYFPLAEEILYTLKDAAVIMDPSLNDTPYVLQDRSDMSKPFAYDFQEGFMSRLYRNMGSGWGPAEVRATGDKVDSEGTFLLTNVDGDYYYIETAENYPEAFVEGDATTFEMTLDSTLGKWYYIDKIGDKVYIDKSGEVYDNNALYLNGIQNFYSIKNKFVPDKRRLTSVSMTIWADDYKKTTNTYPIRVVTSYLDQSNYTFFELYNKNEVAQIKWGKCVDGKATVSAQGAETNLMMSDKIDVSYTISQLGTAEFVFNDQHGNQYSGKYTMPNITWDFAISAAHNAGIYYDNLVVSYTEADWTTTEVNDIVVYYTSNTFLDTDSVVLLHGEELSDTVSSVELVEVDDTMTSALPQYISRTGYDYNGVVYYDCDGNYLTKNDAGNWTYTCTTEGREEYGKQVILDASAQKWYYYVDGTPKYIEGKSAEVTSEHFIDPIPNEEMASVFSAKQSHKMNIVQKTYSSLKFIIPSTFKQGMYLLKINNINGDAYYYYLNAPWVDYTIGSDGKTTAPGKILEVIGENLAPHIDEQLEALDESSADYAEKRREILNSVKVYMTDGTHNYNLEIDDIESDYRLQVKIPGNVYMDTDNNGDYVSTKYEIMVHSNFGDDYCWSIPYVIHVAPDVRDSWGDTVYSILDFDASLGQASNNAAAVTVHALDYITNNGGGTLYFPGGYYKFDTPIVVPSNVRIVGESKETTNFICSDYYYMIGELPSQLFYFGGNAEFKNISVYAERTGGFVGIYGDKAENIYIENCRFRYQHNAGAITLWGPVLVSSNEAYALIRAETRSFLIGAFAETSNIQFRDYHQSASIQPEHRPIVVWDKYAEYWVLQDFYTNGGWGELYAQRSMLDGGEGDDVCFGAWSKGMYIQDWFFNKRTTNNHEIYVADMGCDIPDTTLMVARDESGNRILDENGLPTVYEIQYTETAEFFKSLQVYVFTGIGEGQTRTIVHAEPLGNGKTRLYLDRPFTTEIISGVSRCNVRKIREDIYFVNNKTYFGISFGFYGAACDVVYDGNVEDRFRDFYAQDWSGDCIWYITYKDNYMTGDYYLWHSNGDSMGHNSNTYSQGFFIDGGYQGKGAMAIALRDCTQIAHTTYVSYANQSKDLIIEHNYTSDINGGSAYNLSIGANGGAYLYKNVFENCTTNTGAIYKPASSTNTNDEGYLRVIVDSAPATSMKGDVNLDGVVDLRDATTIRNYVTGKISLNETQKSYGDLDGDDKVTLMDATYLRYYIAGYVEL